MTGSEETAMARTVTEVASGVRLLKGVDFECCIWLIEGRERALLVDTGLGLGDLRAEAETLTHKPLIVVNTHGHGDHSGGNYAFERVYMHPAARQDADAALEMTAMFATPSELLAIRRRIEAKPTEIGFLHEGEELDLGGRQLEVYEIPGHTPGDLAFYDRASGLLFSGDSMVQAMDVLLVVPQTVSVRQYTESIRKLAALEGISGFCSGHDQHVMPKSFLMDCLSCAEAILAGTASAKEVDPGLPGVESCLRATWGDAAILYFPDKIY